MRRLKRIPRVISHDFGTSSEEEGDLHSNASSGSGQTCSTPNMELPEIHIDNRSDSSFEYGDYDDYTDSEQDPSSFHFANNLKENLTTQKRDDSSDILAASEVDNSLQANQTQKSMNEELEQVNVSRKHSTYKNGEIVDQTSLPAADKITTETDIRVISDDEDMDISDGENNEEFIKETEDQSNNYQNEETEESYLKQFGITSGNLLLKYCIFKSDRLYCNFNPSLTRGCQIHFAKDALYNLVSHLKNFHGVDCTSSIDTQQHGRSNVEIEDITIRKIYELDGMSLSSVDELLYNGSLTEEEGQARAPVDVRDDDKDDLYDPENECTQLNADKVEGAIVENVSDKRSDNDNNNTSKTGEKLPATEGLNDKSTSNSNSNGTGEEEKVYEKPKTKAQLMKEKKERRAKQPFVSRVTPKVLRSRSAPDISCLKTENTKVSSSLTKGKGLTTESPTRNSKVTSKKDRVKKSSKVKKASTANNEVLPNAPEVTEKTKQSVQIARKPLANIPEDLVSENVSIEHQKEVGDEISIKVDVEEYEMAQFNALSSLTEDLNVEKGNNTTVMEQSQETEHSKEARENDENVNLQAENNTITSSTTSNEETPTLNQLATIHTENIIEELIANENISKLPNRVIIKTVQLSKEVQKPVTNLPLPVNEKAAIVTQNNCVQNEVIHSASRDDTWPFELGFGFFMKNRYHCNVSQSSSINSCKARFLYKSAFIQHLSDEHRLTKANASSRREDEETYLLENDMARFILSNGLLSNVIQDRSFIKMLTTVRGAEDDQVTIPSAERMCHLIQQEYDKHQKMVKKLLQAQKSISFSIHVWNPESNPNDTILIITAFYIDDSWKLRDVIVGFQSLSPKFIDSCVRESLIEIGFVDAIKSLGIEDKVRAIVCPDIPSSISIEKYLDHETNFKVTDDITKCVISPCLNQVIEAAQDFLFHSLEKKFSPIRKINEACLLSKSHSKAFSDTTLALQEIFTKDYAELVSTKSILPLIEKFNLNCILYSWSKRFTLNSNDQLKIKKTTALIGKMKQSLNWLVKSSSCRYPTASKMLIICMQLMDSIFRVASCYGIQSKEDLLADNKQNNHTRPNEAEDSMEKQLGKMFALFSKYIANIEKMHENFYWQALVLDTAAFAAYDASISFGNSKKPTETETAESNDPGMFTSFAIDYQALEINHLLNSRHEKHTIHSISDSLTPNRNIVEGSGDLAGNYSESSDNSKKRKRGNANDDRNSEESDLNISHKRKCRGSTKESILFDFENYILQFKRDQSQLLFMSGIEFKAGKKVRYKLLHDNDVNLGQMRFWENAEEDYYPEIAQLTKQSFSVPTTSTECLRASEYAKKYYNGLSYIHPESSPEQIQQHALMYIWKNENNIIMD